MFGLREGERGGESVWIERGRERGRVFGLREGERGGESVWIERGRERGRECLD